MDAVEAGGDVEHRTVGVTVERDARLVELGVLQHLAGHEDRAEQVGEGVPLAHAPLADLEKLARAVRDAVLGLEHAELTPHGRDHEDRRVDGRERDIEVMRAVMPQVTCHGADREVHREQAGKEHEFASEPYHRANGSQVGSGRRSVPGGDAVFARLSCSCGRHPDIMSCPFPDRARGPPKRHTFVTSAVRALGFARVRAVGVMRVVPRIGRRHRVSRRRA